MEEGNKPADTGSEESKVPVATSKQSANDAHHHKYAKPVLAIVFVVLLLIIGALSYTLINDDESQDTANSQDTSVVKDDASLATETPEKVTELKEFILSVYENQEFGFTFSYPIEWGEVEFNEGSEQGHLVSGYDRQIAFSKNPDVTAGFFTTDYKHNEAGHDGTSRPGQINFSDLEEQGSKTYYESLDRVLVDEENMYAHLLICYIFCDTEYPRIIIDFVVNLDGDTVSALEFYYDGPHLSTDYLESRKPDVWDEAKISSTSGKDLIATDDYRISILRAVADSVEKL